MPERYRNHLVGEVARIIVKAMLEKAVEDAEYRELCLTDPAMAFKQVTGRDLCEGASLRFAESGTIVLPSKKSELSDEELERVREKLWNRVPQSEDLASCAWYGILGTVFPANPKHGSPKNADDDGR